MQQPSVEVSLIAAMASNRVIGDGPRIPWRIPGEQKIFKRLTEGKVVAMGRKTFESIGIALPNRRTVVITRQPEYIAIYALAFPIARRIHLTEIHRAFAGDAVFPNFSASEFHRISSEEVAASIPYSYSIYERKADAYA